jgi:two-component system, cell cycle sensor histidine kinase and response regulator CckA
MKLLSSENSEAVDMEQKTVLEMRARAEAVLKRRGVAKPKKSIPPDAAEQILQELHVYQIELELQNDELRRTQVELQAAKDRFSSLYDFAPVGYFTLDERGIIVEANITATKTLEADRSAMIGTTFSRFVDSGSQDTFYLTHRKTLGSREAEGCELMLRTASGRVFDAHLECILFESDSDGKLYFRCAVIDITRLKHAEKALRLSEEKFRTLIEESAEGFLLVDEDGTIIEWNKANELLTGIRREEVVGQPAWEVQRRIAIPEHRNAQSLEEWKSTIQEALKTGTSSYFNKTHEVPVVRTDGKTAVLQQIVFPIKSDKGFRIGSVISDISERKQTEEILRQTQKTESLGVLAGGVAHDFNNLLQAMIGQTTVALKKLPPDSAARENIEKAVQVAERAAHLTQQLLAYSGRGKFEIRAIDLNTMVSENLHLLQVSIPKQVRLKTHFEYALPAIEADRGQIQQVTMNLIINAGEAIGENHGTISVTTRTAILDNSTSEWYRQNGEQLEPGRYVIMEVEDTGCGMSKETIEKIFDPFFTTKFTGRGLGLAAVLGIVRGHKGALKVESIVGKGTRFSLAFPASKAAGITGQANVAPLNAQPVSGTVLLIDDEEFVREAVTDILVLNGLKVYSAISGEEGIALYQQLQNDIHLVLLDLSMPGMSGDETFHRLREVNPSVRVILSSGYSESEATAGLTGKGLAGFIHKPYHADFLVQKLREHLEEKKQSL